MIQLVIGLAEPNQHRRIEPVLRFRPVDADQKHAAVPLNPDISRLRRDGWSGGCRYCLRTRGIGTDEVRSECNGPGTCNHEISTRDVGGCCAMGVGHEAASWRPKE